nr:MAG TPA: hypothetical protein [Caudoviricetes sp.]
MKREHHFDHSASKILTHWKTSNFITECLLKGYHIAYYHDTGRLHYWNNATNEYHIATIDLITSSETGLGIAQANYSRANR